MYRNINIILILLHSVAFCEDGNTIEPFTETPAQMSTEPDSTSTGLLSSSSSSSLDVSSTHSEPNSPITEPPEEPHTLTSGQIAGAVLGSITGAAALGGGIYAGLKYTGKLPA